MSAVKLDLEDVRERSAELARYQIASGERVLLAHPLPRGADLLDVPAGGDGDCYWVDRVGQGGATLQALAAEYVGQARRMGCCPMSAPALEVIVGLSEEGLAAALADSIARA